jgi:hypothetical protein
MYRFLQSPPGVNTSAEGNLYTNTINTWNSDIHLMTTYAFLSKEEAKIFAKEDQVYLVKDVFQYQFDNSVGSKKVSLNSVGMISSWMWYFQRNDVNLRNEWSNYTNWPYRTLPSDIQISPRYSNDTSFNKLGPYLNLDNANTGIFISGNYSIDNQKDILLTMAIVLDGKYRENILPKEIYDYIEKYTRTNGNAQEGLYCYNFCLDTSPYTYQPSGAINLGKFKNIELEFTTYVPPIDATNSNFQTICDGNGNPIGVNKSNWKLYDYSFDLTLFEERYNILSFIGGNCGMLYSR